MRKIVIGALIAGLALAATSARAADAPVCAPNLGGSGERISLAAPLDEPTRLGLSLSVALGLDDSENPQHLWPRDVIESAPACALRDFEAAGKHFTLSGGVERVPPRFAVAKEGEIMALAILPSIPEGYAIYKGGANGATTVQHPNTALVLLRPTRLFVLALYDGQPSDDRLVEDMKAAANRGLPVIASFHMPSGAVSLNLATASGHDAFFLRLPASDMVAIITAADGDLFRKTPDGGVIMTASGFACPAAQKGFRRDDMLVIDARQGGVDLACRFFGTDDDDWISTFVTRYDDGRSEAAQFDTYLREGRQSAPPNGEVAVDQFDQRGGRRAIWTDREGRWQEMVLVRLGKWYVQLRATSGQTHAADVEAAIQAIVETARRTVHEAAV